MATTPTMGRPPLGSRTMDTPEDIKKRRMYWGIALAVIILVAIGLMRNRNTQLATTSNTNTESTIAVPGRADTMQNRAPSAAGPGNSTVNRDTSPAGSVMMNRQSGTETDKMNRGTGTNDGATYPQQQGTPGSTGASGPDPSQKR